MLNVFYLISIILGISGQNIVKKPYTKKTNGGGVYFFNTLVSATALLFFALTSSELHFDFSIVPYAIGFAATYSVASIFSILAIANGSLSLTSLCTSFSLMIPTFYGLIFLKDAIGLGFVSGLILLAISLFLINKPDKNARVSVKWLIFVLLAFLGNGMCTVMQNMQQRAFDGAYKSEFMILSYAMVAVVMLSMALFKDRKNLKLHVKAGWYVAPICGALNGMVNLFVMILSARMAVSLMFPLISAGGLVVTYLVSRFVYKEKLTKLQFAGFVLGAAAVVLLNIK
jgi:drug/metabolite transporter (DMT)-like permease